MTAELMTRPIDRRPMIMDCKFRAENGGPINAKETAIRKMLMMIVTRCGSHFGSPYERIQVPIT